jgi:hypothetical protein
MTTMFAAPLEGLGRAQQQFESSAARIANPSFGAASAPAADQIDLSAAAVAMLQARAAVEANLSVVRTADEMERATLDLLA